MEKLDAKLCYTILDLKPGATQAQIKEAYRKLAMQWHPDRHAHNPKLQAIAQEKIKEINAANEFLKAYAFGPDDWSQSKQGTREDKNKQESEGAERRKQEAERQRQKVEQQEREHRRQQAEQWRKQAERAKQEAERRKQEAKRQEKERGKQEAERQKLKAEQPEKDWQERQEKWRKEEEECLRIGKEKEARIACEREQVAQAREKLKSPGRHYFHQGKCLRCGRSKASLAFYPDAPCP